ncbi:hypothetical protein [Ectobacillus ponti]|uniref:Uncharacterized protein n=1 Tax=Ectobacillus ponti TaxID=2961894 RepID=A0AA42BT75_9BACI|nr:hypothetical protein [Ectobacillus ponti]MCP8971304.1 hypothetical protein [Ectobacillus ponti]
MKRNTLTKWVVGLGSVAGFTLFAQYLNNGQEAAGQDIQTAPAAELAVQPASPAEREQQLLKLDWNEGQWEVTQSNETIVAAPRMQASSKPAAKYRSRRS